MMKIQIMLKSRSKIKNKGKIYLNFQFNLKNLELTQLDYSFKKCDNSSHLQIHSLTLLNKLKE